MLEQIVRISGIPAITLEPEIKEIHEKHGTSEYAFLIEEIPALQSKHPGQDLAKLYEPAILAYREARKKELYLYPSVRESLVEIRKCGCLVIGYTESLEFYSKYRIRKLGLDGLLDVVYFPPDHDLPDVRERIRRYSPDVYELSSTKVAFTSVSAIKPNPELLSLILENAGAKKDTAAYVGDSLMKDVVMAQRAGVKDVWAKYGASHKKREYELLKKVTHWKIEAVKKEEVLTEDDVSPTYVLTNQFAELLGRFEFTPFNRFATNTVAPKADKVSVPANTVG